jgi:hypothetical protein
MARQNINIGSNANDGTGDDLRSAMQKINTNFTELYAETAVDSGITISGNTISSNRSDDDIVFEPSGVGAVRFPAVTINDNAIIGTRSNEDLTISASGTGNLILGSLRVNGTTISSDDSTKITLAESVDITGTLNVSTLEINNISSADSTAIQINDGVNIAGITNTTTLFVNDDNITIARRWNDDSTRASSLGKSGDTAGMIAWEDDAVYVCTANYDGSTQIWRRAAISAF